MGVLHMNFKRIMLGLRNILMYHDAEKNSVMYRIWAGMEN